ncbi:MAG: 6-phosphofructokinase [Chloroflexi bacterium]|nr:6-phosphofructokinase [Chloroflexota bacterium]
MSKAKGNLAVGQSGGPTVAINSSLCGVIQEAMAHDEIGEIYGMYRGIRGLLQDQFIDLRRQSSEVIEGLRHTPGAALGTVRYKVTPKDYERILEVLKKRNIRYLHYIGGNDSADTSWQLYKLAADAGYELHVIGVPKTVDNDLWATDHCPGYPSAARFVAMAVRDTGRDTEAMGPESPVKIVEIMGRNAGWLTAAAALAREEEGDAPHLVYVPERPVSVEQLVEDVKRCYEEREHVVIAMSEGAQEAPGKTLGEEYAPKEVDAFGHRMKGGVSDFVATLLTGRLGLKVRLDKPNYIQRSLMVCASPIDLEEAYRVGRQAVKEAIAGRMEGMITLIRDPGPEYHCSLGVASLGDIANRERMLPPEFMNEAGNYPTEAFFAYARPLIGELQPKYVRLTKYFV